MAYVLSVIQVKSRLRIHEVTSLSYTCVQFATNDLQLTDIWTYTVKSTQKAKCTHVANVINALQNQAAFMSIWIFIQANTSAQIAGNAVEAVSFWKYTCKVIPMRKSLSVPSVTNDSDSQVIWLITSEFTAERNHTNVTYVTRHLARVQVSALTWDSTREKNPTNVTCVTRHLFSLDNCLVTSECTMLISHTSVHSVIKDSADQTTYADMYEYNTTAVESHLILKLWQIVILNSSRKSPDNETVTNSDLKQQ